MGSLMSCTVRGTKQAAITLNLLLATFSFSLSLLFMSARCSTLPVHHFLKLYIYFLLFHLVMLSDVLFTQSGLEA